VKDTWHEQMVEWGYGPLYDQIHKDSGKAPCCHWGTDEDDFDRYVVALVFVMADSNGDDPNDLDPDVLDSLIGAIVNDGHGQYVPTFISYRHAFPEGFMDWLDPELFTDSDEGLEARFADIASMAHNWWDHLRQLGVEDTVRPFTKANDLKWGAVCDYWAEKED